MKRNFAVLLPAFVLAVAITPNLTPAQSAVAATPSSPASYVVVQRGADYKVWQKDWNLNWKPGDGITDLVLAWITYGFTLDANGNVTASVVLQ
jgi:hypothetical protein